MMTLAPAPCSRRTIAAPTRRAPPVTSATLPSRAPLILRILACSPIIGADMLPRSLAHLPAPPPEAQALSDRLRSEICAEIEASGGWIAFARFMELALYAPGLG